MFCVDVKQMYTNEMMNHIDQYLRRIIELQIRDVVRQAKDKGEIHKQRITYNLTNENPISNMFIYTSCNSCMRHTLIIFCKTR